MKFTVFPEPIDPPRLVPVVLATVAGYVDACTFLGLFGLYVAQVTGSFVTIGARVLGLTPGVVPLIGVPAFFAGGVAATIAVIVGRAETRYALTRTFVLETLLLVAILAVTVARAPFIGPEDPSAVMASLFGLAAMGVQSAAVRLLMKDAGSTNVMTMNTTQIAVDATQLLAAWLVARHPERSETRRQREACRHRLGATVPLPLSFLLGTVVGALAFTAAGFWALVAPAVVVGALARWATRSA